MPPDIEEDVKDFAYFLAMRQPNRREFKSILKRIANGATSPGVKLEVALLKGEKQETLMAPIRRQPRKDYRDAIF